VRDPRFNQPAVEAYGNRVQAETEAILRVAADRSDLDAQLQQWWAELLSREVTRDSAINQCIRRLSERGSSLSEPKKRLVAHACAVLEHDGEEAQDRAGAYVLGVTAAATIRATANEVVLFDRAVTILRRAWRAVEVLIDGLDGEPRWPTDPDLLARVPTSLDELASDTFGRRLPSATLTALLDEEQTARARGLRVYLWQHRDEQVDFDPRVLARLSLLARRDWSRVAAVAEALPIRELREMLWWRLRIHEDRDAILALIRISALVFRENEWTGRVVGLHALTQSVTHADRLRESVRQRAEPTNTLEQAELPDWFNQVVNEARRRPDGRALLLFYTAWLVREVLQPRSGNPLWSSVDLFIRAAHQNLGQSPTVEEMKALAGLCPEENTRRSDSASYLVAGAILGGDAASYWTWYRDLLTENDNNLCWQARTWTKACCYDALARKLSEMSNPFPEWETAWNSLFVTDREAARFDSTSQNALFPSVHLIRVGATLLRLDPRRPGAGPFYAKLRASIRNVVDNDLLLPSLLPEGLGAEALDLAPAVLGEDWLASLESERAVLDFPKTKIIAASGLLDAGVAVATLESNLSGLIEAIESSRMECDRNEAFRAHWNKVMTAVNQARSKGLAVP